MSDPWDEAERAWESWTAGLAYALSTLGQPGRHDALFIYPEPSDPDCLPLSGPSIRIIARGPGPTVALAHYQDPDRRWWGRSILPGGEREVADQITEVVRREFGCLHPSFVRFGGVDIGADADLWARLVTQSLMEVVIRFWQRRSMEPTCERFAGEQLGLFSESVADPSRPMLWD